MFANEELDLGVVPLILSYHEDYLMRTASVPLVSNQARYAIPSRAMGNKIREVQYQDVNGTMYEMSRIFIEDLPYFQNGGTAVSGAVRSFYIEGNEIVITPINNTEGISGNLLISYYTRCSELVAEDRVTSITNINRTTGVITLADYPTNFPSTAGTLLDFTSTLSPFNILAMDIQPTALGSTSSPTITLSLTDIPTNLRVGDSVSLAEETILPQIPVELRSVLAQRVAIRCLEALGDLQGVQLAMAKLTEMEEKTGNIMDNRVEGAPFKIAPKHTFLRRSRTYLRR